MIQQSVLLLPITLTLTLVIGCDADNPELLAEASPRHAPKDLQVPFEFAERLASVDVTVSDEDAVVTAYDSAGESIGSLAMWVDAGRLVWIAADFPDGYMLTSVDPITEAVVLEGNLSNAVFAERAELLVVYLADPAEPQEAKGGKEKPKHSWLKCGGYVAVAAFKCHKLPLNPVGCIGSAGTAACACIPKVIKEFEGYKCPGVP